MSDSAKPKITAERGLDVLSTSQTAGLTLAKARKGGRSGTVRLKTRQGRYRVDQTQLGALQGRAAREGGVTYSPWADSHQRMAWLVCGKGRDQCIQPREVVLQSGEDEATPFGSALELHVRCRICEPCLKAKAAWWKLRAMAEIGASERTWFITLTWRPEDRLKADYSADRALRQAGIRTPTPKQLFVARAGYLGPIVSKWLQRIRKGLRTEGEVSVSFRYLLVWEEHADGFPHAHLLLHEKRGQTVTKRRVQREWQSGFSNCRLVVTHSPDDIHKSAAYVCKYLTKSMLARVRASTRYGRAAGVEARSA